MWGAYEFRGWQTSGRSPTRRALSAWFPVGMLNVRPFEHPVIAVLPLENLSADADSEDFADGLTEEIIRSLDRIQGLEVKSFISHASLEPGFADAYLPLMPQAAAKALELDELLAEGHAAMGFVYARKRDWEGAQKSFRRAIELNPSLTQSYSNFMNSTLIPLERLREAEDLLRVALRVDPLSPDLYRDMGFVLINAGRYDEAIDYLTRARAIQPDLPFLNLQLARALTFAGRTTEALALWEPTKHQPGSQGWIFTGLYQRGPPSRGRAVRCGACTISRTASR
jgi:tetratricopeptide (TPR) repeat protein